jgi:hypothetical protein
MLLNTWQVLNSWQEPIVVTDDNTPGVWEWYDYEQARKDENKQARLEARLKAKEIDDELHRALALAERANEEEAARLFELDRLNQLVAKNQEAIRLFGNKRLNYVMKEALERKTFSTNERLERELGNVREEEFFLMAATLVLMNQ